MSKGSWSRVKDKRAYDRTWHRVFGERRTTRRLNRDMKTVAIPSLRKPAPGTDAAIDSGCTCPVMDNERGRGYLGQKGVYVYNAGCPIHGNAVVKGLRDAVTGKKRRA